MPRRPLSQAVEYISKLHTELLLLAPAFSLIFSFSSPQFRRSELPSGGQQAHM
jgi:hypothetical protein